ncbi:hypothetical protein D9M72_653820 [compost metagenome]
MGIICHAGLRPIAYILIGFNLALTFFQLLNVHLNSLMMRVVDAINRDAISAANRDEITMLLKKPAGLNCCVV